jgi:hypothetical protein
VKIHSSDKTSNPNAVAAFARSECKAFRLYDPFLHAAVIRKWSQTLFSDLKFGRFEAFLGAKSSQINILLTLGRQSVG